ncbi:tetratricopeptide repeat protein [Polynucleobacter sp. JS-JIR-5-A7]|uniref:tetratricopeptide repeat protein n=1 Tax=Polynucleobacter sp. JS-JIR-5-A7 TaxID=1758395 RepID=UPI001BFDBB8A|nr:tetratricopeptide repeat protein [Polynucleobacter sp. JS-JIR-5-A7]QWE06764.1 tetratricopeptide repeat protein [Polynucleobacter sp. JS-JIR-5-A7]
MTTKNYSMVENAINFFQNGNLNAAEQILMKVLLKEPKNLPALSIIGLILGSQGRSLEAEKFLNRALKIAPNDVSILYNLANALSGSGKHSEAIAHYSKVTILCPDNVDAWLNLGLSLSKRKKFSEALNAFDKAIALKPGYENAYICKSATLNELNCPNESVIFANLALSLNPRSYQALNNKGLALKQLFQLKDAFDCLSKSVSLNPLYAEGWCNLGSTLYLMRNFSDSLNAYKTALEIHPNYFEAWSNIGGALKELGQYDQAIASQEKAIQLAPNSYEGYWNLAVIQQEINLHKEAIKNYEKVLTLRKDYPDAIWNLSHIQLKLGNFTEGWKNYESRKKIDKSPIISIFNAIPELDSIDDIKEKNILVFFEQGLGDTIQFCRYIPLLNGLGANIHLFAQESLIETLRDLDGLKSITSNHLILKTKFDFRISLLSLPFLFKTSLDSIPSKMGYLKSNLDKKAYWESIIKPYQGFKIGLVWSGGFRSNQPEMHSINARRNIDFSLISELQYAPNASFFSLQKGEPAESELLTQKENFWAKDNFHNFAREFTDFSDTAAFIDCLDLVISVDTSTAHLAGALGKPVWILNRFDSCWRWLFQKTESPWYTTAKIYNQQNPNDWQNVIKDVKNDLIRLIGPQP